VLVGIHHPSGDQKKISQTTSTTSAATYLDRASWATSNTHIKVTWAQGTTEGGSSGSAVFNPEGRIVGQLHGGYASCSARTSPDWCVSALYQREIRESERDRERSERERGTERDQRERDRERSEREKERESERDRERSERQREIRETERDQRDQSDRDRERV
jgi:hypothetical protein